MLISRTIKRKGVIYVDKHVCSWVRNSTEQYMLLRVRKLQRLLCMLALTQVGTMKWDNGITLDYRSPQSESYKQLGNTRAGST